MTTKVKILGAHTEANRFFEIFEPSWAVEIGYGVEDSDYGDVELIDGELGRVESVKCESRPWHEPEPCKPVFDDRYTGKCKKFRRGERGWR